MGTSVNNKIIIFPVILAGILFVVSSCKKKQDNPMAAAANQVKEYAVITLQPTRSELNSSYPAVIRGMQDIEIRPKIAGFITQLLVDEGAVVKKGQPLFKIDPVQYQAAVQAAQANVNVAQTTLETSRLTLQNKQDLHNQNIIGDFELQSAQNDYASKQALLDQAQAQLLSARNDLSYTTVVSPTDGVVGSIPYRVGSLVSSTITGPLTTVSDISSVFVYFSMTEKQLLNMTRQTGSLQQVVNRMPWVQLQLADGTVYPQKGKIETVSGVIDPTTGSVSMRATFDNSRRVLRSGGTGVILIPHVDEQAIVIPQKATYEIQDKKFVYLVTDSSTVKSTPIEVYGLDNGKDYQVTEGLKAGDRLVVEGVGTLRDGTHIKPITPEEAEAKIKQMAASGQQQGAAGQQQQQEQKQ